jgi:hypothetical protein
MCGKESASGLSCGAEIAGNPARNAKAKRIDIMQELAKHSIRAAAALGCVAR